jgi:integrase
LKVVKARKTSAGGIRIQFIIKKHRYSVYPVYCGRWDNSTHREMAQAIANRIATDITLNRFDASLVSYQPKIFDGKAPSRQGVNEDGTPDLLDLWEKFVSYKKPHISITTLKGDYSRVRSALRETAGKGITEPIQVFKYIQGNRSSLNARRLLMLLNACLTWAVTMELIDSNPIAKAWELFKRTAKVPKQERPESFETEERDKLIAAAWSIPNQFEYAALTEFLFFTGCRPSEAMALEWIDVQGKTINFSKAVTSAGKKAGLKWADKRVIRKSSTITKLLLKIKAHQKEGCRKTELVFPAPKGKGYIDWTNYGNRFWKKLFELEPGIRYLSPYHCRHTFATLGLKAGVPYKEMAEHLGNSPEVTFKHYQGVSKTYEFPEF